MVSLPLVSGCSASKEGVCLNGYLSSPLVSRMVRIGCALIPNKLPPWLPFLNSRGMVRIGPNQWLPFIEVRIGIELP